MGPQNNQQFPSEPTPQPAQPQPMPMPMQPTPQQPVMGAPAPQPMMTGMPPKRGLSKGALWGIIGGGIGLLLLIVGIILAVVVFGPPSKADYQKAYDKAESMVNNYNSMSTSTAFSDDLKNATSDSDIDAAVDKMKSGYDKDNAELLGMKALSDSETKKAFDVYKKKYDDAFPYIKQYLKKYLLYKNVMEKCSYSAISALSLSIKDRQTALNDYDSRSKDCVDFLNNYKDSSDSKVSSFANSYLTYISKMRSYAGDYADAYGRSSYPTSSRPSVSDLPYASDIVGNSSDLNAYDFTNEFNDFVSVLAKKK